MKNLVLIECFDALAKDRACVTHLFIKISVDRIGVAGVFKQIRRAGSFQQRCPQAVKDRAPEQRDLRHQLADPVVLRVTRVSRDASLSGVENARHVARSEQLSDLLKHLRHVVAQSAVGQIVARPERQNVAHGFNPFADDFVAAALNGIGYFINCIFIIPVCGISSPRTYPIFKILHEFFPDVTEKALDIQNFLFAKTKCAVILFSLAYRKWQRDDLKLHLSRTLHEDDQLVKI